MRKLEKLGTPDPYVMLCVALLVIGGLLLVFDASYANMGDIRNAKHYHQDIYYMVKRQLIYALIGLGAMIWASRLRLQTLLRFTLPLLVLATVLLVAVLAPGVGYRVNGAVRWLKLGPISVQPSEIAKFALVLYLAGVVAQRKMRIQRFTVGLVPPLVVIGLISGLVVLEPDLGTTLAIVGTCFIMLYAGGVLKRHLLGLFVSGVAAVGLIVAIEPYRMERIYTWLNPRRDPFGDAYQIIHSLIGLGTGGVAGVGLCEGREKLYIPAASTDFIFATLGEEAGLIGGLILLGLFFFLTYRGLDIARRSKSTYGNMLAVGVTSMIGLQALVNIAVVSASIPATGVPLPFVSYGGSSLVFAFLAAGVLLSVSSQTHIAMEERELYENSLDGWRDGRAYISGRKHRASASTSRTRRRVAVRR